MASFTLSTKGFEEFKRAIARSPQVVSMEATKFLQRGIAVYQRSVRNNPWRVGGGSGGSPVATTNLRESHRAEYKDLSATLSPDYGKAPYAVYVHEGTRYMEARPWLDYAVRSNENELMRLEGELLTAITNNLAS